MLDRAYSVSRTRKRNENDMFDNINECRLVQKNNTTGDTNALYFSLMKS